MFLFSVLMLSRPSTASGLVCSKNGGGTISNGIRVQNKAVAAAALETFFRPHGSSSSSSSSSSHRHGQRPTLVLLLDEIDFLLTKKQSVLYNLLHWPTAASARLLVIGISNTLDFADRCVRACEWVWVRLF